MTPYFLIYGRIVRLPIGREVLSRNTLLDRVITLVYKLPIFRKSARIVIKRVQEKMRQNYDAKHLYLSRNPKFFLLIFT